eukprot:CAMPEP_0179450858 /NCGR_PEP_ID=MMETSP0799-20121207/34849_1 /TAXON_ID=46947 /ORGANISM="Geminigera cryophila, Strain CCMP2564" /LENGTH=90 /DNA_ID=CAMNT_0021245411 /DNA_START=338 /DNA_END=607 /DNA_ORIENTATION=+
MSSPAGLASEAAGQLVCHAALSTLADLDIVRMRLRKESWSPDADNLRDETREAASSQSRQRIVSQHAAARADIGVAHIVYALAQTRARLF